LNNGQYYILKIKQCKDSFYWKHAVRPTHIHLKQQALKTVSRYDALANNTKYNTKMFNVANKNIFLICLYKL